MKKYKHLLELAKSGESLKGEVVIDSHTHLGRHAHFYLPFHTADEVAKEMKRVGVRMSCVFSYAGVTSDFVFGNDLIIDAVKKHPDKFTGYAMVNPNYPNEIIPELERAFKKGLKGIKIIPGYQNYPPEGRNFYPMYEWANTRKTIILSHNFPETKIMAEITRDYPDVTFILGHYTTAHNELIRKRDNLFLSTTALCGYANVEMLVRDISAEKTLYGSDFTYLEIAFGVGPVLFAKIKDEEKRKILGINMLNILKSKNII